MKLFASTTAVYESYWHFAAERLAMYYRRLSSPVGPWTSDPILRSHRFTNVFRAADRVSQFLIGEVQYGVGRSQEPEEVFFRTVLFKLFNRIDTWQHLERKLGALSWRDANLSGMAEVLDEMLSSGRKVYSAAYIMPSPNFGEARKHANHLALLRRMMAERLPARVASAGSLRSVYELLLSYPGLGPFLAFQYAIDLNYSSIINFDEADYVVAGPGALDGISKCFSREVSISPQGIINAIVERQDEEFRSRGLHFNGLFGRPLKPIDCQNIFCEISKYARAAHPEALGANGRTRIKQKYNERSARVVPAPFFPPKWGIIVEASKSHSIIWDEPDFELTSN
ncbi:TPA: nucleotide kinase domain-containing protein [Stenotrophomonas maltophilia]